MPEAESLERLYEVIEGLNRRLRALEALDRSSGSTLGHNHTAAAGQGGVLTDDEHDGFSEYAEIAAPGNPAANKLRVYAKDDGAGLTWLYDRDSAGTERKLGDTNADTVDSIHAAAAATANYLVALTASSVFPADVVAFDALTLAAQVWASSWSDATLWTTANSANWQNDTQTGSINPRRKSTVVVVGITLWRDATATRTGQFNMRWDLNGTPSFVTGVLGSQVSRQEGHTVIGIWTGVTAGAKTLTLQAQKTTAADATVVFWRAVVFLVFPED